jgi:hypothetical protein
MIYYDLDGVLRCLSTAAGNGVPGEWNEKINGRNLIDIINDDHRLLETAPDTQYCSTVKQFCPIQILSHQNNEWVPHTIYWLLKHFSWNEFAFYNVTCPEEKLEILKDGDYLIEDYPFFKDYSKVALIDWAYNKDVDAIRFTEPRQLKEFIEQKQTKEDFVGKWRLYV